MGKTLLSVSFYQDSYHFMEIDKQAAGYFPQAPSLSTTTEALHSACRRADEIYVNCEWPTALYGWETFPKMARRNQYNMVTQAAREKAGVTIPYQAEHKVVKEITEAGVNQVRVAYIGIPQEDLKPIWATLGRHISKVKVITPMPVALASMVSKIEKPEANFIVIWVGETSSVMAICSADGVVKMARTMPVGVSTSSPPQLPEERSLVSEEFSRELFMTSTFFKQEFREPVPALMYFLGSNQLPEILAEYPLTGAPAEIRFGLSDLPVRGMGESQAYELSHLISNLYASTDFNFFPVEFTEARQTDTAFKLAIIILLALIVGSAFWAFTLFNSVRDKEAEIRRQLVRLENLQQEIIALRTEVAQLEPFEGWKNFYEQTYASRPAWNMIFSELGLLVDENIIIENFSLGENRVRGAGAIGQRTAEIAGQIKANTWEEALTIFRKFGERLQGSPFFEINSIQYSPDKIDEPQKLFDFKLTVNLKPRGSRT